jgi:Domain of unknown function (DUF3479)
MNIKMRTKANGLLTMTMPRRKRRLGLVAVVVVLSSLAAAPPVHAFLPSASRRRTTRPAIFLFSSTLDKQNETTESTPTSRIDFSSKVNVDAKQQANNNNKGKRRSKIVLVAGFESFNRGLYQGLNDLLDDKNNVEVTVFADSDIRLPKKQSLDPNDVGLNPRFARAVQEADSFIGSLIFDYDDVLAVKQVLPSVKGPRVSVT